MIYKLIILIRFMYQSLTKINRAHIGRFADYRGETVELKNGVSFPYWSVKSLTTGERYERIHLLELRLDNSYKSKYRAFRFHLKWLMGNHFNVAVQKLRTPYIFELTKSK